MPTAEAPRAIDAAPSIDFAKLALFRTADEPDICATVVDFARDGQSVRIVVEPASQNEAAKIASLRDAYYKPTQIAYRLEAMTCRINGTREFMENGADRIELTASIQQIPKGGGMPIVPR